ncbi:neuronal acetylcholine receptor subunit beta-3-like [Pecten maximus]|uniref:neuronal acetylcholine receptor subunit beta-3-like n=1 Tax=Pecten maximus TaxID=6579 RepID=UPI001457F44E|nr:neuronal acetylcholine receptor subunit beta-3-like [Pecten maximus]
MVCNLLVLLLIGAASLPGTVHSATSDNVKALYTNIFTTNSYNKRVRPSLDLSTPTNLYVDLDLVAISDISEVQEKMTTTASLFIMWTDEYLKWNPSDYNDTMTIYLPQDIIWKPDIALENGFSKLVELGDNFILTTVSFDGSVIWRPFEVFDTKCSINIKYFPFDQQTCSLKFGVWTNPLSDITIAVGSNGVILQEYQSNGEWDIVKTSSEASVSSQFGALVTYTITVQRKPQYILLNVVLPILLLSILSVFVFALPIESGEKMGYVMTVYLAFAVFLTIVSASLPESSSMSLLSMYLVILVLMGTAIVIITTLELRLHYRDSSHEISKVFRYMIRSSKILQCKKSHKKVDDSSKIEVLPKETSEMPPAESVVDPEKTEEVTWPDVTSAIDFFCFWFFLIATIVITIGLFASGYINGAN